MDVVKMLMRGLAALPGLVQGVEAGSGVKTGSEKKAAVLGMVRVAVNVTDAVAGDPIADAEGFTAGLGKVIDGVVECLNASVWAKR